MIIVAMYSKTKRKILVQIRFSDKSQAMHFELKLGIITY